MSESGPSRPELMGGNGARAAGVSVPRAEPQATTKMITLQLQRTTDGNNNEGTIVCSVQCDQAVLCQGSNLIKNLLGTMPEDEPLPPFSAEHIVDGETLRRVVELIDLLPSIPEEEMVEPRTWPTPITDIHINFLKKFKLYLKQDGNRGEMLKVLVAAHYLDCPKIVFACSVYLANAFHVCITNKVAIFGSKCLSKDGVSAAERFISGTDPLGNAPMPIIAEIADRTFQSLFAVDMALQISSTLGVSLAYIDRMWANGNVCVNEVCSAADLSNPSCQRLHILEKRFDLRQNESLPLFEYVRTRTVHERWTSLVEKLSTAFVNDDSQWVNGAPTWLMEGMNLGSQSCFYTQLMLRRLELKPVTTVVVPHFTETSSDGKKLLELARDSDALSIGLRSGSGGAEVSVANVDELLGDSVNLSALDIRQKRSVKPPPKEVMNRSGRVTRTIEQPYEHPTFPARWKQLLEVLLVDTMRVEYLTSNMVRIFPALLKRLWIRNLHDGECAQVIADVLGMPYLEDLVLEGITLSDVPAESWRRGRKTRLRVWIHHSCTSSLIIDAKNAPIDVYRSNGSRYTRYIYADGAGSWDVKHPVECPIFFP